jgi:hypothetical protein
MANAARGVNRSLLPVTILGATHVKEAARLIELENKIAHPPNGGSKDATDAAAAAFFGAIRSEETRSLSLPQGPPVVVGISPMANASPEDPFGFLLRSNPGSLTCSLFGDDGCLARKTNPIEAIHRGEGSQFWTRRQASSERRSGLTFNCLPVTKPTSARE